MSSLNIAVVLTLIAGLGGAVAGGFTFRAPWWAWPLLGVGGLFIGLIGAILQNQIRVRFLEKENEKGVAGSMSFVGKLVMPFIAVILVTIITVSGSILLTRAIWPEEASNPRNLGRLEGNL